MTIIVGRSPKLAAFVARNGPLDHFVRQSFRLGGLLLTHAEHRPSDYRFARQRSDRRNLQETPPLQSYGSRLRSTLLLALASFALMALAAILGDWLMG